MINSAQDMLGQEVTEGDTIAAVFNQADSPVMRVGIVTGFNRRRSSAYDSGWVDLVEVKWYASSSGWGLPANNTSKIEVRHKRFLKVTLDSAVQDMLY